MLLLKNFLLKTTLTSELKHLINKNSIRVLSSGTEDQGQDVSKNTKAGTFADSFKKFENINKSPKTTPETFAGLLRNSKFIDLGDPEGKVVIGNIFHIVDNDLYIDFGWKFHCVCSRPKKNGSSYVRGAKVRLRIKQLELSTKFLGYEKDLTLLEADCILLGLASSRSDVQSDQRQV